MRRKNILIVEDETIVALEIKERLESSGYVVIASVTTAEEAIRYCDTESPNLVLMDIMLNGEIDGIDCAKHIYENNNIPVIFLTANSDSNTLKKAMDTSPYGFIVKPFNERDLLISIDIALDRHEIEKQLKETKQLLYTILRCMSDGIVAVDLSGEIRFVNPAAEILLWSKADVIIGTNILEITDPVSRQDETKTMNLIEYIAQKRIKMDLNKLSRGLIINNKKIDLDGSVVPIIEDNGEASGVIFVLRNKQPKEKTAVAGKIR